MTNEDRAKRGARRAAIAWAILVGTWGAASARAGEPAYARSPASCEFVDGRDAIAEASFVRRATLVRRTPGAEPRDPSEEVRILCYAALGEGLPATVDVHSAGARDLDGAHASALDARAGLPLVATACPARHEGRYCAASSPLRVVIDELDRDHPRYRGGAIVGELGGTLVASGQGAEPSTLPVGDDRHRARIRSFVLRSRAGGAPAIGGDDAGAVRLVQEELVRSSAVWGVCGITFRGPGDATIRVVDPPPPHLLAIGCGGGRPASGGEVRVLAEGRELVVPLRPGATPREAARAIAEAARRAKLDAVVSDDAPTTASAYPGADVLLRRSKGALGSWSLPVGGVISTDATLRVCVGSVELEDGLSHFADADATAGTLEERTLLKAFDDGDPSTIDVYVVPGFSGGARIGESFIDADDGALRGSVIEDRAGLRLGRGSFTLAHELGHVLLDLPGHPDDLDPDDPTLLMDADAVAADAFGPRRLRPSDCRRALAQSGPNARARILAPWPVPAR